ncbi:uncharacterized protein PGTG_22744 [Puccinia graminis f. sp. tritici CRL 75-36-700-3]|uniref:DNA 3'-5' helicase n=1 Tax=Puccinia graminis f. sp. tritici (strain CRL 75-36-700-3 / race SCCL) TaxID=418459 RepID=H6QVG4_PUCGT|nr:uncharacterized protein PGTG_22744 [Puccinia graminis f. sp. tritici CRL 75-36-700-3]EHS62947.1 hypothetical protein PGTG_22744 [Puccinia graminis f. sp. tritici CRL 75-36-700-3]
MQVSKVIHEARRIPGGHNDAHSTFARRFHACTGDMSKEETTNKFAAGEFPVIACTMALGLGQNWKRVRSVVHVGQGDPASICQMIGRCGRGGSPGLAILFVEANQRSGKNTVDEFANPGLDMYHYETMIQMLLWSALEKSMFIFPIAYVQTAILRRRLV